MNEKIRTDKAFVERTIASLNPHDPQDTQIIGPLIKQLFEEVECFSKIIGQKKTEKKRWQHLKRGSTYIEIGRGRLQIEGDLDMTEVVVYMSEEDGLIWVRPVSEFEDGRFESLD